MGSPEQIVSKSINLIERYDYLLLEAVFAGPSEAIGGRVSTSAGQHLIYALDSLWLDTDLESPSKTENAVICLFGW